METSPSDVSRTAGLAIVSRAFPMSRFPSDQRWENERESAGDIVNVELNDPSALVPRNFRLKVLYRVSRGFFDLPAR